MMIVPKSEIKTIYTYLLNEGVMVVKKDFRAPKHANIPVPNLHVMNVMKSLKSRGYVTETFNWQYHYFCLTDEGILFLRNYLHMPESVVPATIAKAVARSGGRSFGGRDEERTDRRSRPTEDYRRSGWRGKEQSAAA